jgi:hypothetical protein
MYTILRTYYPEATTGVLLDEKGEHLCFTLELPWIDNKQNVSAIPEGTYHVKKYSSKKWPNVWEVTNVLDRTAILIHWGNKVSTEPKLSDVQGCILVGESILSNQAYKGVTYKYWLTKSRLTIGKLRKKLPNRFVLEIRKG